MHLNTVSKLTRLLFFVGIAAIAASLAFAQVGSGGGAQPAVVEACSDYPTSACTSTPSDIALTYRGGTSGCTPTSGTCLADEYYLISAVSNTYCFQFCDTYRWTFGDDGSTTTLSGYPQIFHRFQGSGPRTVNLTITNSFGTASSPTLTVPVPLAPCSAGATTLCLNNGRFQVRAIFSAPSLGITNAPAQVVPLTADTGYFWFFSANNVEVVLKVVDGRAFNGAFWVFYGALSDVQYTVTVTDTATGAMKTYSNTAGHLASVADTGAFRTAGGGGTTTGQAAASKALIDRVARAESAGISGLLSAGVGPESTSPGQTTLTASACTSDATTLCLNNGRFQVRAIFTAPSLGITNGAAQAVPLTSDTGYFWFFSSNNVEIVAKAVDGRAFNNFYWFFYGALSDVAYTITVTDTERNTVKTYTNQQGILASVADTQAFPP